MRTIQLAIIGGGSAGMAAAINAYDQGVRDIVIFEKDNHLGGILFQCIHSGFGLQEFKEQLSGPEYAERFIDQIKQRHIEYKLETTVMKISMDKEVTYSNSSEGRITIKTEAIVLASGCRERSRGAVEIPGDRPSGVMTAGVAQHYLNIDGYLPGKKVFILGSGDIGLIMARRMTLEGAKVLGVAELMPYSNGLNRNIVQCLNDFDIPLYLSHTVTKIIGKDRLKQIELSQVDDHLQPIKGSEKLFDVDLLLLSIGLIPDTDLLTQISLPLHNRTKGAIVNESLETQMNGVFSCGNALHVHDLVDFVTAEGRKAGDSVAKYLAGKLDEKKTDLISTKALNGIGYVLPCFIHKDNVDSEVNFNFRVTKPFSNVRIVVKANGGEIKKVFKQFLLPSEMESLKISKELIPTTGEITVEVVE